jgi:hypothetical protein
MKIAFLSREGSLLQSDVLGTLGLFQGRKPTPRVVQFASLNGQAAGGVEAEFHPTSPNLQHDNLDFVSDVDSFSRLATKNQHVIILHRRDRQ